MEKDKVIILEGAQGVGKTTITNMLREQIPYSLLYRLSGIEDKTDLGMTKIFNHYVTLLDYLKNDAGTGFTHIFDRIFVSEQCYSQIGVSEYDFTSNFEKLLLLTKMLESQLDITFILLEADESVISKRLESHKNKVKHAGLEFMVENSIKQQLQYKELFDQISRQGFRAYSIDTSSLSLQEVVDKIKEGVYENRSEGN